VRAGLLAALLGGLLAAAALAGCAGVQAADLFIVYRTGSSPQARLTMLINEEGGVRCNGGRALRISDSELVRAHAIQEDLHDLASRHLSLAPRAGSVLSYYVRDENGSVRFSDNSARQPAVLRRLQLLVVEVAQRVCHLPG
jgi:hypothetical protein